MGKCIICGSKTIGGSIYCSNSCKNSYVKNCLFCGEVFTSHKKSKFCSNKCKKKYSELHKSSVLQVCSVCKKKFLGNRLVGINSFCSVECFKSSLKEGEQHG